MSQVTITNRTLSNLKPSEKPYFLRDCTLKGFGVKVNPTGAIKFVAEVWHEGKSNRKTLGEHPVLNLQQARIDALTYISLVKSGQMAMKSKEISLGNLFNRYISGGRLKDRTIRDYKEAIEFYFSDWLNKPVSSITKQMVEKRFCQIRDKGIFGGKPTYSQATKTMRILSALMNYARADDLIELNPVEILKLKRIDRSTVKRENFLPSNKVRELLQITALDAHPVTLAVHLILHSGLRKNEALRLKWSDIEDVAGMPCVLIRDTKNKRPHYVPITTEIRKVLDRAKNDTEFIFPSTQKKGVPMGDVRSTLNRLSELIGVEFKCHDLRRTFATRASEVGIDYLMIKRMLNHKSNDITGQYIQWHSMENLLVMREAMKKIIY